jgi:putative hydrolase of the HAD superfamily
MPKFDWIAFDADDTLWHTEHLYANAQARFVQMLSRYHSPEWVQQSLYATETRNIAHFGFGVKAFALSMIETAVELTEGRISGQDIQLLVETAKEMLSAEVVLIDQALETLTRLAADHRLMVVTKGDLLDQESKIMRSGLGEIFQAIEIVSDKNRESYQRLFKRHAVQPSCFLMVGNSLRSDILPVLEAGGSAVYIPYSTTWLHEIADAPPPGQTGFYQLERIDQLPGLVAQLESAST